MLIRRCAWHRSYRGYPIVFGVASWRGWRPSFTDGMCLGCSAKLRREWKLPPLPVAVDRYELRGELVRVAAMAVMAVSVLLATRPLDDLRMTRATLEAPQTVTLEDPQTVLAPPASVEIPAASPAVTRVARRPGTRSISRPLAAEYLAVADAHILMEPVHEASRWEFPAGTMFAAVPHAGLMQQTP
jgi:hypothetical protein